jgi:uncharacterized repeat protein (TIGR01451 family)
VTLEKFNSTQSPVVYDVTVSTLDSTVLVTDLGVSITGNQSSLNVGDTVKLTVTAFNNGPNSASVKVNYKIPLGLKLLSSQGTGTYDPETGVWSVGILPAGGNVTLELTLQANNAGAIVNTAIVYSDLSDLNPADNQAGFSLIAIDPNVEDISDGELNGLPYTFPPDIKPPNPPTPPDTPPTPEPHIPPQPPLPPGPGPSNTPTTQLARDISYIRDYVGYSPAEDSDEDKITELPKMPEWNVTIPSDPEPTDEELKEWESLLIKTGVEVFMLAVATLVPNEYLREVQNGFVRVFSSFEGVLKWLGLGKQVKQVANLLKVVHKAVKVSWMDKWLNRFSAVLDGLGPNVGMKILEQLLVKVFPSASIEIKIFLNAFSVYQFVKDPFGTLNAIIDAGLAILSTEIPDPEDVIKFLIADPLQ